MPFYDLLFAILPNDDTIEGESFSFRFDSLRLRLVLRLHASRACLRLPMPVIVGADRGGRPRIPPLMTAALCAVHVPELPTSFNRSDERFSLR